MIDVEAIMAGWEDKLRDPEEVLSVVQNIMTNCNHSEKGKKARTEGKKRRKQMYTGTVIEELIEQVDAELTPDDGRGSKADEDAAALADLYVDAT
jgi:hypothetical protein